MTSPSGSPPPAEPPAPQGDRTDDTARTERIDALATYFRENAAGFTSDALRRAAVDAGHEPREIDAAWAVSAEPAPVRGRASLAPPLITVAYIVGTYAIVFLLASIYATSALAVPALGVSFLAGILAWLMLRESRPDVANAFRSGVILAIVVPLVLALVALGVCLVATVGFSR